VTGGLGPRCRRIRRRLASTDRRLLAAAARRRSPVTDRLLMAASETANRSVLWMGVAAVLTATGQRRPRTAAASGLLGIGIAATLVNGPLKFAWRRDRPPTVAGGEPLLPLPRTFSFPSGHSASALAFATGATAALPLAGPVLVPAAGAVAYSRVHTGVHYPSDVAVGASIGVVSGLAAAKVVRRLRDRSVHRVEAAGLAVPVPRTAVLLTADGSGSADDLEPACTVLEDAGFVLDEIIAVDDVARLRARLHDGGGPLPLVVAAGGDGTVCAAVNAVHGTDALLAVIPLGTSNDVARSLGIPPDGREAACLIAGNPRVVAVDAGRVRLGDRDQVFLNAAPVGLNVAFAQAAPDGSLRNRFGGLTYPVAAARAVRSYEPFECTVEHDGGEQTWEVVHLSVSNAPVFGGVLGMRVPGASMTDGLLDVTVVERLSIARLALAVADTVVGQHRPVHRVHTLKARSLRVSSATRQELALDGEVIGALPAEFEVLPAAVRVIVPDED
jgi:undecaprenyl-diphosphatase